MKKLYWGIALLIGVVFWYTKGEKKLHLWALNEKAMYIPRKVDSEARRYSNQGYKLLVVARGTTVEVRTAYQTFDTQRATPYEVYEYRLHGKLGDFESTARDARGYPLKNPSTGQPCRMTGWITSAYSKERLRSEDIAVLELRCHHADKDGIAYILVRTEYKNNEYVEEITPYHF